MLIGDGLTARLAAAALGRMLPRGHLMWLAVPTQPAPIDHSTRLWPIAEAFHERIALPPEALAAAGACSHRGERFEHWPSRVAWSLPSDADAIEQGHLEAWLADRSRPLAGASPDPDAPLTRIDPVAYGRLLEAHAARMGVERRPVTALAVESAEDGGIARVIVDGHALSADWYIDTVGTLSPAPLRSAPTATGLLAIGAPPKAGETLFRAASFGWSGGGMTGFAAGVERDAAIRRHRVEAAADPRAIIPVAQYRRDGWAANVLALGPAAFTPDPVAQIELALIHSALLRLGVALPAGTPVASERAEANRRGEAEHDAAADYARVLVMIEREGPYWQAASALPVSAALERRLDLFSRRGRLPPIEDDPVPAGRWRAMLAGLGHAPARPDPLARAGLTA